MTPLVMARLVMARLVMARLVMARLVMARRRRALAIDGKTVRGSRHLGPDGAVVPGRHLLAVIDQHTRVVLGQVAVDTAQAGKGSEITRFTPLLGTLT